MAVEKISVALLLSDLHQVQKISSVFKKLGIDPHFYEDLKAFWKGTLKSLPALCIVDVKNMSEGELLLCEHPAVIAEQMPLVFFYNSKTEPLMVSTHSVYHLGVIKEAQDYEGPLKSILKRQNKMAAMREERLALQLAATAQKGEIERLQLALKEEKKSDVYEAMVRTICVEFEKYREQGDFFRAIEKVFQAVEEIEEFAFLELSLDGHKLLSPVSHISKFKHLPTLRSIPSEEGIGLGLQNTAGQMAIEAMGGDLVSLVIKGVNAQPDKLIYVKAQNEKFYHHFDWNMLEAHLNGLYASFQARMAPSFKHHQGKRWESSFLAMSALDQFLFGQSPAESEAYKPIGEMQLVDLDLSPLVQKILEKSNNRFFWGRFEREFISRLEIQSRTEFKFFAFGISHLGFLIRASDLDLFFDELKSFSQRFPYWKYFEDVEGNWTQMIVPVVSMSPLSARAYLLRVLKSESEIKESLNAQRIAEQKKTWNLPREI